MITLDLKEEALVAGLARLSAGLDDMTPVMDQIGLYLVESTVRRFGEGVDPDGNPWAANSPVTLARKSDPRPLFREGNLSDKIFHEAGPDQVEVGSNRVQAAMMQFGGTKAAFPHLWGDIPARPFIGVSPEDETALVEIVEEYLAGLAQP